MKIYFNKKVGLKRAHLFHNNIRNRIYKKLILNQIKEFKKNKKEDDVFVLIEVGSLIGASIEIWGNELSKRIKNFTIISIDPFEDYVNQKMKNDRIWTNTEFWKHERTHKKGQIQKPTNKTEQWKTLKTWTSLKKNNDRTS